MRSYISIFVLMWQYDLFCHVLLSIRPQQLFRAGYSSSGIKWEGQRAMSQVIFLHTQAYINRSRVELLNSDRAICKPTDSEIILNSLRSHEESDSFSPKNLRWYMIVSNLLINLQISLYLIDMSVVCLNNSHERKCTKPKLTEIMSYSIVFPTYPFTRPCLVEPTASSKVLSNEHTIPHIFFKPFDKILKLSDT